MFCGYLLKLKSIKILLYRKLCVLTTHTLTETTVLSFHGLSDEVFLAFTSRLHIKSPEFNELWKHLINGKSIYLIDPTNKYPINVHLSNTLYPIVRKSVRSVLVFQVKICFNCCSLIYKFPNFISRTHFSPSKQLFIKIQNHPQTQYQS